jgi:hypothetical protein
MKGGDACHLVPKVSSPVRTPIELGLVLVRPENR